MSNKERANSPNDGVPPRTVIPNIISMLLSNRFRFLQASIYSSTLREPGNLRCSRPSGHGCQTWSSSKVTRGVAIVGDLVCSLEEAL